jgi:hypothetical protein
MTSADPTIVGLAATRDGTAGGAVTVDTTSSAGVFYAFAYVDGLTPTPDDETVAVSIVQPAGFVASPLDTRLIDVDPPEVVLNAGNTADYPTGTALATRQTVRLNYAPPTPVDITVSVPSGSGLTLSTDSGVPGTATLLLPDVDHDDVIEFWVQDDGSAPRLLSVDVTATASAYDYLPDIESVVPRDGVAWTLGALERASDTVEATRSLSGLLTLTPQATSGAPISSTSLFEIGPDAVSVDIAVDDPAVLGVTAVDGTTPAAGAVTVTFAPGTPVTRAVEVTGIDVGVGVFSVAPPTGYVIPGDRSTTLDSDRTEITVTGRPIFRFPPQDRDIGRDLSTAIETPYVLDSDLTVTVLDPGVATVSRGTGPETGSLVVPAGTLADDLRVNGVGLGATTVRFDAVGYTPAVLSVDVLTPTLTLRGVPTTIDRYATGTSADVRLGVSVDGYFLRQYVRAGLPGIEVALGSSATNVLTVSSPATVPTGASDATFLLDPVQVGFTTVSATATGFAPNPSGADRREIEVTTPTLSVLSRAASLPTDHRDDIEISVSNPPPLAVTMTATSSAPSVVTVSTDPTVVGTATASATLGTSSLRLPFTLHGLQPGSSQITFQVPGYSDRSIDVVVQPSYVAFTRSASEVSVSAGATASRIVEVVGRSPSGDRVVADGVRPGAALEVELVVDDPSVAVTDPTVTFDGGGFGRTVTLTGAAAGTTAWRVVQPTRTGYVAPLPISPTSLGVTVS